MSLAKVSVLKTFSASLPREEQMDNNQSTTQDAEGLNNQVKKIRRNIQKLENQAIGEGGAAPIAENVTLDEALERFVFITEGSFVGDINNPNFVTSKQDWSNALLASTEDIPSKTKIDETNPVQVSKLWLHSSKRKTVETHSFKAGFSTFIHDPYGRPALNSWRGQSRQDAPSDWNNRVRPFTAHIDFLFDSNAPRFLDWLAHIEQHPEVLPHTAWLHISRSFGLGRNWVASVLVRLWKGNVAANVDLPSLLNSGYNGYLSRKILAIVDEIREGGGDSRWRHAERMKSLITEETRVINPKYGRQSVEYNSCRWLMFSNHIAAIPIDQGDRRFEVVYTEKEPKDPMYYMALYNSLEDPLFISSIGHFLSSRDIKDFNPGQKAEMTEAKAQAIEVSLSDSDEYARLIADHWPSDLIEAKDLRVILSGYEGSSRFTAAQNHSLSRSNIRSYSNRVKLSESEAATVYMIRNHDEWSSRKPYEMKAELKRLRDLKLKIDSREKLDLYVADAENSGEEPAEIP
jgi:hypothetical protein